MCTSDPPIRSNLAAKFKHEFSQCGTELIQYVTLQFRDRCRAALLRYKRCTENAIFMCEQWPIWYDFHVGIRAMRYYNSHPKRNCRPPLYKILGGKQGVLYEFCK